MKSKLRFAVIGTGFWANYQIPAWMELDGVELVALYNRTKSKAEILAHKFNVPHVYDSVPELLKNEKLDFDFSSVGWLNAWRKRRHAPEG